MAENRKSFLILALAFSLVVALAAVVADEDLREKLGTTYYIISLAIIGSVLMVMAGYLSVLK